LEIGNDGDGMMMMMMMMMIMMMCYDLMCIESWLEASLA